MTTKIEIIKKLMKADGSLKLRDLIKKAEELEVTLVKSDIVIVEEGSEPRLAEGLSEFMDFIGYTVPGKETTFFLLVPAGTEFFIYGEGAEDTEITEVEDAGDDEGVVFSEDLFEGYLTVAGDTLTKHETPSAAIGAKFVADSKGAAGAEGTATVYGLVPLDIRYEHRIADRVMAAATAQDPDADGDGEGDGTDPELDDVGTGG